MSYVNGGSMRNLSDSEVLFYYQLALNMGYFDVVDDLKKEIEVRKLNYENSRYYR